MAEEEVRHIRETGGGPLTEGVNVGDQARAAIRDCEITVIIPAGFCPDRQTMAELVISAYMEPMRCEIRGKAAVAADILRHAVADLHDSAGSSFRQPFHGVNCRFAVRGRIAEIPGFHITALPFVRTVSFPVRTATVPVPVISWSHAASAGKDGVSLQDTSYMSLVSRKAGKFKIWFRVIY